MQNIERKKVMEHIGMKLTDEHVRWAALGGSILGGGGGGSAKTGAEFGDLAVRFSQLDLTPLDQIDPETVVVTASMVGDPAAQEKFVSPADMMRCVELFTQSTGIRPGGIVTNENGGGSTFNGWLEASMLGIPLIDAPCNGRAHPTGVMGSLNLHRDPNYITTMTCVGGRKELGRHVECTVTGSIVNESGFADMTMDTRFILSDESGCPVINLVREKPMLGTRHTTWYDKLIEETDCVL